MSQNIYNIYNNKTWRWPFSQNKYRYPFSSIFSLFSPLWHADLSKSTGQLTNLHHPISTRIQHPIFVVQMIPECFWHLPFPLPMTWPSSLIVNSHCPPPTNQLLQPHQLFITKISAISSPVADDIKENQVINHWMLLPTLKIETKTNLLGKD